MGNVRLYIIGNGFDRYHGLKTSYADFCRYVKENDKELYGFLEGYLYLELDNDGLWCNFEKDLGTFDHRLFYGDHDNTDPTQEKFQLSDMFGVVDELDEESQKMSNKLREALYYWIAEIEYPNNIQRILSLDTKALFLTFNYTETLCRLYPIPSQNILHIHNSLAKPWGSGLGGLVFGHGNNIERLFSDKSNGNYPSSSYSEAEDASKMLLFNFYKATKTIIHQNISFFDSLYDIENIIVLGHSINDIDLPYFEYINKIANKAKWTISYYDDSEPERMSMALSSAGLGNTMVFKKMEDIIE